MPNKNRRGRSRSAPAPPDHPSTMSITISLQEIYAALCPACREAFLALLEAKASHGMLRDSLRRQLDPQGVGADGNPPIQPSP